MMSNNSCEYVIIIGGGRRGIAILETLKDDEEVKIICIIDINEDTPGMKLAKRLNIPTDIDFIKFIKKRKRIDVVFNATGERYIDEKIKQLRPEIEIISGLSLKLVWGLIAEREKAIALQRDLYRNTIGILTSKMESKNIWAHGHPEKVTEYATLTGQKMGLLPKELEIIKCAGILHDVGKLGINDEILLKTERLTEEEYQIIKEHPVESESIVKSMEFLYTVLAAIRHHHERYDGMGYPDGLKGEGVPLSARILAVADSFCAMTAHRPYCREKTIEEALDEIKRCSGTQFDPEVIKAFEHIIHERFFESDIPEMRAFISQEK
ncbi:HD-GYP domain-containing protein [bacterium]|nr:HD-GYP domain-containing protein [bacterium]MBU1753766.1 HD-GYP domain-containing protein [bacterium]